MTTTRTVFLDVNGTLSDPAPLRECFLANGFPGEALEAWLASSALLYFASAMRRFLGERGLIALERLMGMVLVTVAVQMLMTGIRQFLAQP